MLKDDGWCSVATKGNHRQFKHSSILSGDCSEKPDDQIVPGTKNSISNKSWKDIMRYAIAIEKTANVFSAYVPILAYHRYWYPVEERSVEIKEAIASTLRA